MSGIQCSLATHQALLFNFFSIAGNGHADGYWKLQESTEGSIVLLKQRQSKRPGQEAAAIEVLVKQDTSLKAISALLEGKCMVCYG
jgi:hypothetical protein